VGLLLLSTLAAAQPVDGGNPGVSGGAATSQEASPSAARVARPLVPAVLVLALLVLGLRRLPGRFGQALRASRRLAADDPAATADLPETTVAPAAPETARTAPVRESVRVVPGPATGTQGVNARTASRHGEGGTSPGGRAAQVTVTAVTLSFDSDVRGRFQVELDALVASAAQEGLRAVCTGLQSLLARNLGAVSAARVEHLGCETLVEARPRFDGWVAAARKAQAASDAGALVAADDGSGQVVVTVLVARRQGPGQVDPPRDLRALRGVLGAVLVGEGAVLALELVVTPEEARSALTEAARGQRFVGLTAMRTKRAPG